LAVWREALLAQKVLSGRTKGYCRHPQLERFKESHYPLAQISSYLNGIYREASKRGYSFDRGKIGFCAKSSLKKIPVNRGQVKFESAHLLDKLKARDPVKYRVLVSSGITRVHPVFRVVGGGIADWERGAGQKAGVHVR